MCRQHRLHNIYLGDIPWALAQQPFSAMLQTNKRPPPCKLKNLERRSREYLLPAEVRQLIEAAKKLGRHSHRDAVLIMMAYRHALRVGELVNLRWDQVSFAEGKIHINRLKHGDASVHYLGVKLGFVSPGAI